VASKTGKVPAVVVAMASPKPTGRTPPPDLKTVEKKEDQLGGSGDADNKKKFGRTSSRSKGSHSPSLAALSWSM
jgi:hypothetical protein